MITKLLDIVETPTLYSGGLEEKQIALTFDDGPHPIYTPAILNILADHKWPAHFFNLGQNAQRHPAISRAAQSAGHAVGSHTYSHANLPKLPASEAHAEIQKGIDTVAQAAGERVPFFRFPYGDHSKDLAAHVAAEKLFSFFWNIDTLDWKIKDQSLLLEHILQQVDKQKRGIILMHDIQAVSVAVLPMLIEELKNRDMVPVRFTY